MKKQILFRSFILLFVVGTSFFGFKTPIVHGAACSLFTGHQYGVSVSPTTATLGQTVSISGYAQACSMVFVNDKNLGSVAGVFNDLETVTNLPATYTVSAYGSACSPTRLSDTIYFDNYYLCGSQTVTVQQASQPATVSVALGSCPAGTTYSSSTGNNGAVPGSFTFTPASNGTTVTMSGAAPAGWNFNGATPSSQMVYQGGTYNFSMTCTQIPPALPPTVNLLVNGAGSTTITSGQSATLSWTSSGADSCTASRDWSGSKAVPSGSQSVSPTSSSTYTIICINSAGNSDPSSVTINVTPAAQPAPTVTLSASPTSIVSGNSTTISWSSTNATSCDSNWWSGSTAKSGSVTMYPSVTTTYTKTCSNANGSASDSVTVTVNQSSSASLTANPSTLTKGNGTILNWTSTNTSSCSGVGFNTQGATSNTVSYSPWIAPAQTTTYTLNCISSVGGPNPSSSVTVTVNPVTSAVVFIYSNLAQGGGTLSPGGATGRGTTATPIYVTPNKEKGTTYTVTPYNLPGYSVSVIDGQTGAPGASALLFPGDSKFFSVEYLTSFNYTLTNSGITNAAKGGSGQNTITETLVSGVSQPVTLSVSGAPAGVSASPSTCFPANPTCTSVITFTVPASTPVGDYNITVTGNPGNKTTSFTLRVINNPAITVSCSASPATALVGQTVTWTANASGGTGNYTGYSWSGSGIPTNPAPSSASFGVTYSTIGQKTAQVTVTDSAGNTGTCPNPGGTVQINFNPQFKEF